MMQYRTKDGDRVDLISWHIYGTSDHAQDIYEANPMLHTQPIALPAGLVINLPEVSAQTQPAIELWSL